jgi:hypothetical protein
MVTNFLLKKRTNPTPQSPIMHFIKMKQPFHAPSAFIIPYEVTKSPLITLPHSNNLDATLKN